MFAIQTRVVGRWLRVVIVQDWLVAACLALPGVSGVFLPLIAVTGDGMGVAPVLLLAVCRELAGGVLELRLQPQAVR